MSAQFLNIIAAIAACFALTSACTVRFTNAERSGPSPARPAVYVPTAVDVSSFGGHAGRISAAVRRRLATDPRVLLTSRDRARWGVDIRIIERNRLITAVERCYAGVKRVGSAAYPCVEDAIHQPSVSATGEQLQLTVDIIAIDLRTGASVASKRIDGSAGNFFVVADAGTTEGSTILAGLSHTPELHALRYLENTDAAIDRIGNTIAGVVVAEVKKLRP